MARGTTKETRRGVAADASMRGGRKNIQHKIDEKYLERVRREAFIEPDNKGICGLTPLKVRAAEEYLNNGGDRIAAVRAASKKKDMLPKRVQETSHRIFNDALVLAYLDRRIKEMGLQDATVRVQSEALHARQTTRDGEETPAPDWNTRLKAAKQIQDMMFKIHDRRAERRTVDSEALEALEHVPTEVLEFALRTGRWPTQTETKRLMAVDAEIVTPDEEPAEDREPES